MYRLAKENENAPSAGTKRNDRRGNKNVTPALFYEQE